MLNKLIESIAIKLNQEFGNGFPIHNEHTKQDLQEPCFFIKLLTSSQEQVIGKRYLREQSFDIHYFPGTSDKNTECLDLVDVLNDVLEYIELEDSLVRGTKMRHEIISDVLHFFVDYNFHVYKDSDEEDGMDTLSIDSGLKGE